MSLDPNNISIVHWFPDLEQHKCGYCKNKTGSVSYGMWAETLTVEDYQNLIDRGWRRSGNYCYKPIMDKTCCPQYTIRCDSLKFRPSKSQKKVAKKFNKFLRDGILAKPTNDQRPEDGARDESRVEPRERPAFRLDVGSVARTVIASGSEEVTVAGVEGRTVDGADRPVTVAISAGSTGVPEKAVRTGLGADPLKPPCKKAKLLRMERKHQKMRRHGMMVEEPTVQPDASVGLDQLLSGPGEGRVHSLRIELVPTGEPGNDWERTKQAEYELYKKYQTVIHDDPPEQCSMKGFVRFLVSSPLKIDLVVMTQEHELFHRTAKLFAKYQMFVHGESEADCSEESFLEFLVSTPLKPSADMRSAGVVRYGSFHQQYWVDETLIAVGVIDVLPRCISSVYFFYDPDYRALTLGTYGALREIQYTATLTRLSPSLRHYYMGFYIHSCPKMRYKGRYRPSQLLCPETYAWFSVDDCTPKLDAHKFSRLAGDGTARDEDTCTREDIDSIRVYVSGGFCRYGHYKHRARYADVFANIGLLVGRRCARSMLVVGPHGN